MQDGSVSTSLQPAYILHYTQWAETSFIVDAFTLSHGRIGMMAKSARSSRPRTRALYQPFRPLLLSWVGGSDLTGIEESGAPLNLANAELACSYYINELVMRLLGKDQPQPAIFAHYVVALMNLSATGEPGQASMESVLRTFELQLLDGLAVLPEFAQCTSDGSAIEADREYHYHPANAVAIPTDRPLNADSSLGIQKEKHRMGSGDSRDPSIHADGITRDAGVRVSGQTLLAMANLELDDPDVLREARPLMRQILKVHLGDKPLKSRELFESLARR